MSDYVEVERRSFFGKIRSSFGGALFGILLLFAGVAILFWNEGRAVKRYKDLREGAGSVVPIDSARVDPANEGKLVHLTGETTTTAPLVDALFGVSATAVKLVREVEMYQWVEEVHSETRDKVGGGSETVKRYSYDKKWRREPVDSGGFKVTAGHQNPAMPHRSATLLAEDVSLGAFALPTFLVSQIGGGETLELASLDEASEEIRSRAQLHEGGIYLGRSPSLPAIGDLRVRFREVPNGPLSVVARQSGSGLDRFPTKSGGSLDLVESGTVSAELMFQRANDRNKALTWAIRLGGFVALGLAFSMVLGPIAAFSSVIPFLGRLARSGVGLVGFFLAGIVASCTVGIAWIFYRPLLGISILVLALALVVLLVIAVRRRSAVPALSSPAGGPPPLS